MSNRDNNSEAIKQFIQSADLRYFKAHYIIKKLQLPKGKICDGIRQLHHEGFITRWSDGNKSTWKVNHQK